MSIQIACFSMVYSPLTLLSEGCEKYRHTDKVNCTAKVIRKAKEAHLCPDLGKAFQQKIILSKCSLDGSERMFRKAFPVVHLLLVKMKYVAHNLLDFKGSLRFRFILVFCFCLLPHFRIHALYQAVLAKVYFHALPCRTLAFAIFAGIFVIVTYHTITL